MTKILSGYTGEAVGAEKDKNQLGSGIADEERGFQADRDYFVGRAAVTWYAQTVLPQDEDYLVRQ